MRRPEEAPQGRGGVASPSLRAILEGPDLSWYRIASRDSGFDAERARARAAAVSPDGPSSWLVHQAHQPVQSATSADGSLTVASGGGRARIARGWRSGATRLALPRLCRDLLETGFRHHRPQLAVRAQGDPGLSAGRRSAELADLPAGPQAPGVGLDRGAPARAGVRDRRRADGRLRHGLRLGLRRDRPARDSGGIHRGPISAGSPRSTRPAAPGTRSPTPTTRPRWPCPSTTSGRSAARRWPRRSGSRIPVPALCSPSPCSRAAWRCSVPSRCSGLPGRSS